MHSSWQGVKRRAMRKLAARRTQTRSGTLPKSNVILSLFHLILILIEYPQSDPHIVLSDQSLLTMLQIREGPDNARQAKLLRHASWPTLYPQGTEGLPVSEADISKLFRRSTIDSVSSGGKHHSDESAEDPSDLVLGVRHVENCPARTPEVVSSTGSPSNSPVSTEGVIPDILITPTFAQFPPIPRAPPPSPLEAQPKRRSSDSLGQVRLAERSDSHTID